jgi:hypothetical protein
MALGASSTEQVADRLRFSGIHRALVLIAVALFAGNAAAAELQWRSGRATIGKSTAKSSNAKSTAAQRFVQPGSSHQHRVAAAARHAAAGRADSAVKRAAFEVDGPQLGGDSDDPFRLRSVVVPRDEEGDFMRSAQLQSSPSDTTPATGGQNQESSTGAQPDSMRAPIEQPPAMDDTQSAREQQQNLLDLPQNEARQPQTLETTPGEFQPSAVPGAGGTAGDDDLPMPSEENLDNERKVAQDACADSLSKLRAKTIGTLNLSIAVTGVEGQDYPFECKLDQGEMHGGRCWEQTTYLWKASALCHKPLYFEDEQLERYGHSFPPCCQPLVSGAHFFTRLPVLPYCMGVEPPTECIYALGHYRPGSCAPYMFEPIPISYRGALFQAGAVAGVAAAVP